MSNKKVLLIFPKTGPESKKANIHMPMGLLSLAAPLVKKGYQVTILDQRLEKNFFSLLKEELDGSPLCAGISTMTGFQISFALSIARYIRRHSKTLLVWGGIHPTIMTEQTLQDEHVDMIVRGEGEETFCELIDTLSAGGTFEHIKGLSWCSQGKIYHNPDRPFCDLNQLPPIPYSLLDIDQYVMPEVPGRKRSLDIFTSRGCPYSCTFCYNQGFNKAHYRMKNLDSVYAEVEFLVKKYNLDSLAIHDDNFFVDIDRVTRFCRYLTRTRIVPEWACIGVRIDALETVDFYLLEKSGCKQIYVGVESGSEKILKTIRKDIRLDQIKTVIHKFACSHIIAHYNFMVGAPDESMEDLAQTIELVDYIRAVDPKAYVSSFHLITPYPGTSFYDIACQNGFIQPKTFPQWAQVYWERKNPPWIPAPMRAIDLHLMMLSYFLDNKVLDKLQDELFFKIVTKLFMKCAQIRWQQRQFKICPEFDLLHYLINLSARWSLYNIEKQLCKL